MNDLEYKKKYLKYKNKYLEFKGGMEEMRSSQNFALEHASALSPSPHVVTPHASALPPSPLLEQIRYQTPSPHRTPIKPPPVKKKTPQTNKYSHIYDSDDVKTLQEDFIEMLQEAGKYDTYTKLVKIEDNYYNQLEKIEEMLKLIDEHEDLDEQKLKSLLLNTSTIEQELNTIEQELNTINIDHGLEEGEDSFLSCCSPPVKKCCVMGGAEEAPKEEAPKKKVGGLKKKLQAELKKKLQKVNKGVKEVKAKKKKVATSSEKDSVLNSIDNYKALCKEFDYTEIDWPKCANINCDNIVPCKYTVNKTKNIVKNKLVECSNCSNKYDAALTNYTLYKRDNKIPEGEVISEKRQNDINSILLGKYPPEGERDEIPPRDQTYPDSILDHGKRRWKRAYCENIIEGRDVYMNKFFNPEHAPQRFEWLKEKEVEEETVEELQELFTTLLEEKHMYIMNLPHENIETNCYFLLNQLNHYLFDFDGRESYLQSWQNDNIFEIALRNDSTSEVHKDRSKLVVINYAYACCYIMPPCECTPNIHLDFTFRKRDLDHIIGAHMLNKSWNIQTLCGNCHFTKTIMAGDTSTSSST